MNGLKELGDEDEATTKFSVRNEWMLENGSEGAG
jgi:hypothetical protein